MSKIPKQVFEEFDRLNNHHILHLNQYDYKTIDKCRDAIKQTKESGLKYIFQYNHETISDVKYMDEIYNLVNEFEIDAVISTSTTSTFPKSTHPLTNILMWRNVDTRKSISWNSSENIPIFDKSFYYGKSVNSKRQHKGILSVRKENHIRDYLFSKNPKIDNGIVRYAKWPHNSPNVTEEVNKINKHPLLNELIQEYEKSFFSFIVESEHGDSNINPCTNLTEKTLIGLLTGTMPIILGGKGIVNELNNMGLKVWNTEFGFNDGDIFSNYSKYKVDSFLNCINEVNKLTIDEVKKYWEQNKNLIQQNYDIISELLFDDKFDWF